MTFALATHAAPNAVSKDCNDLTTATEDRDVGDLLAYNVSTVLQDLSRDVKYTARHRQGSNDIGGRRPPLLENFLSELESADNDY